jgi:glucuronate isomerase
MARDPVEAALFGELCRIPLIDPHTHIDPLRPVARSLDDILGYHYYTELAHSAGMDHRPLRPDTAPIERVRAILTYFEHYENTVQAAWFLDIARVYLDWGRDRVRAADADELWERSLAVFGQPGWEEQVLTRSNLERVFLTNDFDDPLEGFDLRRYIPCLRTDDLVFSLHRPEVRERLARVTGVEVTSARGLREALARVFRRFVDRGARACAVSLPPDFAPAPVGERELDRALYLLDDAEAARVLSRGVFWLLAEMCQDFGLPFDLMAGVNRRVYSGGVHQGQDLFDQRTSLIQYAELFNAFPKVTFCVSVLSAGQNQELASYSWIFPNVVTAGHWWYANVPAYIEQDCRARLQAVPQTKQLGYYSDAYKLEFVLPKFDMYRRVLARVLARDFVGERGWPEGRALDLGRLVLRGNVERVFRL